MQSFNQAQRVQIKGGSMKLPDSPAKFHGDVKGRLELEWAAWREWAMSLKDYGPPKREKRNVQRTETRISKQRDGLSVQKAR